MPILYKVVARKKPGDPNAPVKYYAQPVLSGTVDLEELSKEVEKISTVSEADIMAVLTALVNIIPDKVANGKIIKIGELGTLRPSLNSEGYETEKEVSAKSIKRSKILFRPGKRITKAMNAAEYKKA